MFNHGGKKSALDCYPSPYYGAMNIGTLLSTLPSVAGRVETKMEQTSALPHIIMSPMFTLYDSHNLNLQSASDIKKK